MRPPKPTRRGYALMGIVVSSIVMGWVFGARSLNAVVMPALGMLLIGFYQGIQIERPEFSRRAPPNGTVGESIPIKWDLDTQYQVTATVREEIADGLTGDNKANLVIGNNTFSYDLGLRRRGIHRIGPVDIKTTDVFGLWKREFFYGDTQTIAAFPKVQPLYESAGLLKGYVGLTDERDQFDGVREYQRGDALRDIDWKHSAKRNNGEFIVTEFAGEGATRRVNIAIDPAGPRVDNAAEATASVAAHLLEEGLSVGLITPINTISPATGDHQRVQILYSLARVEQAPLNKKKINNADIIIRSPKDGSHIQIETPSVTQRFGELISTQSDQSEVPT